MNRVVGADRSLYGFRGERQDASKESAAIQSKRVRLTHEGVSFDERGRISSDCIMSFDAAGSDEHASDSPRKRKR